MGCDIHANFEIRVGGEWLYYSEPDIDRDYELFTRMAGVRAREGVEPISQPRGLPEDITPTTALKNKWFGVDGHSHSWLSSLEVIKVIKEHQERVKNKSCHQWGYLDRNGWEDLDSHPKEIEDFRLVFWFDN